MHAWEAIQKAVDYIEENLKKEINTEQLAEMVSLSPFYFQRLFQRLVNRSVQEYVKLRRLSIAIDMLNDGDRRILDIALDFGFSSHANFTRAFKETYGMTPEAYKKGRPMLNTVIKPALSMNYVMLDEGVPLIIGDIVLEISRKTLSAPENYIGLAADVTIAAQTPIGETTGMDVPGQLWARFHTKKTELTQAVNPAVEFGMSYMPNPEKGVFTYFAGVLLKEKYNDPKSDFVLQELPAGDYVVCKIEAENFETLVKEALDKAGKYLFKTWLPNHQFTSEPFSAEKYYTDCGNKNCMELWVKRLDKNDKV